MSIENKIGMFCYRRFVRLVMMQRYHNDEAPMKANDLYIFLEAEFGKVFKPDTRSDGRAYYWHESKRGPASTRLPVENYRECHR
jgi:hypothetical protein